MPICTLKNDVALLLLKLRTKNKYSQDFVADCLGISRNTYMEWEKGNVDFSLSKLQKICDCYDIAIEDLLKNLPPPPPQKLI